MRIEIEDLVKCYGKKRAVDSISLEIKDGVFGLLGKNGAGKTTLMRILATLVKKTSGKVLIDDIKIEEKKKIRQIIGYLPQEFSVYPVLNVYEAMDYLALLSEIKGDRKKLIYSLLEKVNLEDQTKKKVNQLSGGMKRRLGIAQAIMNNPQLLIVDEPTAGLDPEERIRIRNLLGILSRDRTVLLSTHIVGDLECFCDKLAVMKEGNICFHGKAEDMRKHAEGYIWKVEGSKAEMEMIINKDLDPSSILSNVAYEDSIMIKILSREKPAVNAVLVEPTLEDSYMKIIKEI